ncbi:MAG: hypothetical protein HQL84_13465 [Magnetococcales bacterium]|nr:hypothetical protein [Magnetococcales bacterium]MBF0151043.1 hypothetical protein [Magnetococcales bacterium]MBF0173116.1 hypothetical protein [Magnetococcales bacterium]MBF0346233.1 hypothetical protein [Magnetococcales bacterium]MBF0632851.1 hypothetical protein [Magnetococcales bacterium]
MEWFLSVRCWMGCVLALLLAGCAGGPVSDGSGMAGSDAGSVEQQRTLRQFRQDQDLRRRFLGGWHVDGSMEIRLKDDVRRHRMELEGKGNRWIRMRVFGPFKNVVMELTMVPDWLRLVQSRDRVRMEVAADSEGMAALTGLAFNPAWLYPAMIGCAGNLEGEVTWDEGALSGVTRVGETLSVNGTNGLLKQRRRTGVAGRSFVVDYGWPERKRNPGDPVLMPEQVEIRLDDDGSMLTMSFSEWKFFKGSSGVSEDGAALPSFPVLYPELGDRIAP